MHHTGQQSIQSIKAVHIKTFGIGSMSARAKPVRFTIVLTHNHCPLAGMVMNALHFYFLFPTRDKIKVVAQQINIYLAYCALRHDMHRLTIELALPILLKDKRTKVLTILRYLFKKKKK